MLLIAMHFPFEVDIVAVSCKCAMLDDYFVFAILEECLDRTGGL